MTYYIRIESPVGPLLAISDGARLIGLHYTQSRYAPTIQEEWAEDTTKFETVTEQLNAYFTGKNLKFNLAIRLQGTQFQQKVWQALAAIPMGHTTSYQKIAQTIGRPQAVRAVGTAIGRNPVCIIVPCHRVIAGNGSLGGYAGGLPAKEFLLQLEGD